MKHLALTDSLMYQVAVQHFILNKSDDTSVDLDHINSPHPTTTSSGEILDLMQSQLNTDLIPEGVVNKYLDDVLLDTFINDAFVLHPRQVDGAGAVYVYWGRDARAIISLKGSSVVYTQIGGDIYFEGVHIVDTTSYSWNVVSGEFQGIPEENVELKILALVNYRDNTINSVSRNNTGGLENTQAIFLIGELRSSGSYYVYLADTGLKAHHEKQFFFASADEFEPSDLFYSDAKLLEFGGQQVVDIVDHIDNYPHYSIDDSVASPTSVLSCRYLQSWTQNLYQPTRDDFYWNGTWIAGYHESLLAPAGSEWLFTGEGHVEDADTGVILVEPVNNGKLLGTLHPASDVTLELVGNVMARRLDHFSCTMDIEVENA